MSRYLYQGVDDGKSHSNTNKIVFLRSICLFCILPILFLCISYVPSVVRFTNEHGLIDTHSVAIILGFVVDVLILIIPFSILCGIAVIYDVLGK